MASGEVIVVGAGVSGLCCALWLQEHGVRPLVLEASDGVGGRVRTDEHEGFLLDRGFQVLLTAYPEVRRVLNYDALDLRAFYPGAKVHAEGEFFRVADPFRRPVGGLVTLLTPVGSLADKLRVGRLRLEVMRDSVEETLRAPDESTAWFLASRGFSPRMVERFFRPFFGGVFLEDELSTSARLFRFLYKMFGEGKIALPNRGMGQIPVQLARRLQDGGIRLGALVREVRDGGVVLESGEELRANAVVVATEAPVAGRLLGRQIPAAAHGTTCLYFSAVEPPEREPILLLEGEGRGPVNNVAVPSQVAPGYAPKGEALIAATVLGVPRAGDAELEQAVRTQLTGWFGTAVRGWRHLRTYRIPYALPAQPPGALEPVEKPVHVRGRIFTCGDHRGTASLNGAMLAGRRAAEAVLQVIG